MSDEPRGYNLKRPSHLIAGEVLRDMEVIANVKFGPQSSDPVHRLADQYQILLSDQDQKILELEARLKLIEQRFDRYCHDGLELRGFTHLPLQAPETQRLLFDSLYKAIKNTP